MTDLEERFSGALHNTSRAWRQALNRRLKYLGVSQASWMTIAVAAKASEPLSQSELADSLGVEGATMVAMVDRLVKAGLVVREPSTTDRRVKRVVLTPAGTALYDKVKAAASEFRNDLLANVDPKKLLVATELLEGLQGIIDKRAMTRPLNRPMITLSIMLATIMQTLDGTIANVALPHMQGTLSASQDQIAWVLTAYIVAAAIATPLTGWLCDRFGQKNVFLASITGFTVASVLCGMSNSLAQIVAARLLQGVFGAALVPLSQVVLMDINPKEKQGSAMAIWGMGVMVGPILGPTLGGWLTDSYNWRWVFFINVPVGVLAAYGVWRYIRPVPGARRHALRRVWFRHLELGDRRTAVAAGPRPTERLVFIHRDLDRVDQPRRGTDLFRRTHRH